MSLGLDLTYLTNATPPARAVGADAALPQPETPPATAEERRRGQLAELREAARSGAAGWILFEDLKEIAGFDKRLAAAAKRIHGACTFLHQRREAGAALEPESQVLLGAGRELHGIALAVEDTLRQVATLPQIQHADVERVPRAHAAAALYLGATRFRFDTESFITFLNAIDEHGSLEQKEILFLKSFLQHVLLEAIAKRAAGFVAEDAPHDSMHKREPKSSMPGLAALVATIKKVDTAEWEAVLCQTSAVDKLLALDPAGAYTKLDSETRNTYRNAVSELAKTARCRETLIAEKALVLARMPKEQFDARARERRSHVGYYLIGEGKARLEEQIGYRRPVWRRLWQSIKHWPDAAYVVGIEILVITALWLIIAMAPVRVPGLAVLALFALPATECAVGIVNLVVTWIVRPKMLPKLDFKDGIPDECATLVAVPILLTSREQADKAARDLEIRHLGNREENLFLALVTDPPDSATQFDEKDSLAAYCAGRIEELNRRYAKTGNDLFFLLHRNRSFNPVEKVWMGWERKRGKLLDLNNLILGKGNAFAVTVGNVETLRAVKYVITLDADTQLPRDTARKLIATMAHPLNRAVVSHNSNTVVEGYGVLQPRVGISIQSANRSRLASLLSGDSFFDMYTRAVSDVYQDLFAEGSFTGKGIYEVDVFQQVLANRFPCNAILSHDMIEGAYVRSGLVTDTEVIDDYPSRTAVYSRRNHRWVRGDWQILFWLLPTVPDAAGRLAPNPISLLSRWKILDNLRRSLNDIALLAALLGGWLFFPGKVLYWTLAALALYILPSYMQMGLTILRGGRKLLTANFWNAWTADFITQNARLFFKLTCLLHQSLITLDAIVRAIVRMTLTHSRLLEWETAEESERDAKKHSPVETYLQSTPWLAFLIGVFLAIDRPESFRAAAPILILWGLSRAVCHWLDQSTPAEGADLRTSDQRFLRLTALRTWRFFRQFSNAAENWLIPDIYKEEGELTAHRVSTTNLGLLLNARQAALDLGHLTPSEFADQTSRTLETVGRLQTFEGHLYNWYDTQTLAPVEPLFISTVDNGNLACSLWTLKQGAVEEQKRPLFRDTLWKGVVDHARMIEMLLEEKSQEGSDPSETIRKFLDRSDALGESTADWLAAFQDIAASAIEIRRMTSTRTSETEAQWWAAELCNRLEAIHNFAKVYAPWETAEFESLRPLVERWTQGSLEQLTPENAGAFYGSFLEDLNLPLFSFTVRPEHEAALAAFKNRLGEARSRIEEMRRQLAQIAKTADALVTAMDFSLVYDPQKKLLTVGYDPENKAISAHHYDLLASESRSAAFAAIAKGEIPQETWFRLGRKAVAYRGERALQSWTGTMFENLMPSLWFQSYADTLLDWNDRAVVRAQQKYARKHSIPWGISESACSRLSVDGHYHYSAFGVPELSANPHHQGQLVVSPYSTFLSLAVLASDAIKNLKSMHKRGWLGAYGFYEAADFAVATADSKKGCVLARSWMAHHQGMSLLAATNVLCDFSMQRRFHREPQVAATERLLHEKPLALAHKPPQPLYGMKLSNSLISEQLSVLCPRYWSDSRDLRTAA